GLRGAQRPEDRPGERRLLRRLHRRAVHDDEQLRVHVLHAGVGAGRDVRAARARHLLPLPRPRAPRDRHVIRGIHHVALLTRDFDRLLTFYRDAIGGEVVYASDWGEGDDLELLGRVTGIG